jgi:preprotein translocase subunit SecF
VPEGLSPAEVGKEIAEHREHVEHQEQAVDEHGGHHVQHDRLISVIEAALLSLVALLAAWSGYSAAKWGSHSSLLLAQASSARSESSLAEIQATQIRTLDSVSFNAVEGAYVTHDVPLFKLTVRRIRAGAQPAFNAWLALRPLKNPHAPADPSDMPQYRIPQESRARVLNAQANSDFSVGESASATADKYVRITVLLAAVLFLIGIGSRFPVRVARHGLVAVAAVLLAVSVVQLLGLPGPPS